jgi:hypothetical protein
MCAVFCCPSPFTPLQVHLATLNGQKVVVKVQRPGLKELFDIDLKNIRALVRGLLLGCGMIWLGGVGSGLTGCGGVRWGVMYMMLRGYKA